MQIGVHVSPSIGTVSLPVILCSFVWHQSLRGRMLLGRYVHPSPTRLLGQEEEQVGGPAKGHYQNILQTLACSRYAVCGSL